MRTLSPILCAVAVCLLANVAMADSKAKTHDGFQFQLQGGLGYYSVSSDGGIDESFSGATFPLAVLLGGSIGKIAIGGGLVLDYAPSPTYKVGGTEMDVDISQFIIGIGAYVDYYFDPIRNGLHIQGFAGWGGLETSVSGNAGGSDPTGLTTYVGVGYQMWITDQWSAGVMGRLVFAPLSFNEADYTVLEPGVVGTLTWH